MKTIKALWQSVILSIAVSMPLSTFAEGVKEINPAMIGWQAFAQIPNLSDEDRKYLFEEDWRAKPLDARAGKLVQEYNQTFALLRKAAKSTVPADWGMDLSEGPFMLCPHLAKAKNMAQVATLRARWFLQNNNEHAAEEDLQAAAKLGASLSDQPFLISSLVRVAVNNVLYGFMAEHWSELRPESIQEVLKTLDENPVNGLMAASIKSEKIIAYDWLLNLVHKLHDQYPGDDRKVLMEVAEALDRTSSGESGPAEKDSTAFADTTHNTVQGLETALHELEPFYSEMEKLMLMPYQEFKIAGPAMTARISGSPNYFVRLLLPAIVKARGRELRSIANSSMVHAALQFRLDPVNGLSSVPDPFGNGPFTYSRFVFDGVDRGFKLKSNLDLKDFEVAFLFVEKPGASFQVQGLRIGQKTK